MKGDEVVGRPGQWMQTHSNKRFFPQDPTPYDICMDDIAHALSMLCRYNGHGVDFYSVAEHSAIMAQYALRKAAELEGHVGQHDQVLFAFAVLLHDAAEAYMGDLPQAVKHALPEFKKMEREIQHQVWRRYNLVGIASVRHADIKELDNRIYYHEKRAMFPDERYNLEWAADQFEPLERVTINCFEPAMAKYQFVATYEAICRLLNIEPEEIT